MRRGRTAAQAGHGRADSPSLSDSSLAGGSRSREDRAAAAAGASVGLEGGRRCSLRGRAEEMRHVEWIWRKRKLPGTRERWSECA